MEQCLQILKRNHVVALKQPNRDQWMYLIRWSIEDPMKIHFTKLHMDDRSGQITSKYSFDSEQKAKAAGAEMQDTMEAEWQMKYARHLHDSSVSSQFSFDFLTTKHGQYNRI